MVGLQIVVLWIIDLVTLSYELSPMLEKMQQVRFSSAPPSDFETQPVDPCICCHNTSSPHAVAFP